MAKKRAKSQAITPAEIEGAIHVIRGQRVMLDSDLAELYGVTTGRLNEQVSRNKERFPDDFAFQLTQQEFTNLISQFAISSDAHGGRRKPPWVFTEQGVAMLSSVLRSKTAARVNIEIMRTFVRLRRLMATPRRTRRAAHQTRRNGSDSRRPDQSHHAGPAPDDGAAGTARTANRLPRAGKR